MDYSDFAFSKPSKGKKQSTGLKTKKPLKSNSKPIPLELKREVLKVKGNFCLMGLCENCGGRAEATDLHHFLHKSQGGKDVIEHLWPINRLCHSYYHDHPVEEKEIFKLIQKSGWKVVWKVDIKQARVAPEKQ
jgi:5-methylcytosine-specific restriction endonuclease McrA